LDERRAEINGGELRDFFYVTTRSFAGLLLRFVIKMWHFKIGSVANGAAAVVAVVVELIGIGK
jgi:hypothetical protein